MTKAQGADQRGLALVAQLQRAPGRLLQSAPQEAGASGAGGQWNLLLSQRKDEIAFPETSHSYEGRGKSGREVMASGMGKWKRGTRFGRGRALFSQSGFLGDQVPLQCKCE